MAAPQQTSPDQASAPPAVGQLKDPPVPAAAAGRLKDPPVPEEGAAAADAVTAPSTPPTYESTEASDTFLLAKRLLADGDFENALQTIGTSLASLSASLPPDQFHAPALAPLYYLYGTTLLYSIEESSDVAAAPTGQDADDADDIQIAWENLETARLILTKLMETEQTHTALSNKQSLDLAQIHLRLGDLQRANGHNMEAVQDYHFCLELRQPVLGPYCRKVADTHFQLGLVYMLMASQENGNGEAGLPPAAGVPAALPPPDHPTITPELAKEYRTKALNHYLQAAKSFAGQIAFLCGQDPETVVSVQILKSGKTTGLDETTDDATAVSATLKAIRQKVSESLPKNTTPSDDIADFIQVLEEIQETVDEAENAKKAITEVTSMKKQAQAAADGEVTNMDGSTTTIGFAAASNPWAAAGTAVNPWANAPAAAAPVQMLQVRKKKKRDDGEEEAKLPAKKTKSEE